MRRRLRKAHPPFRRLTSLRGVKEYFSPKTFYYQLACIRNRVFCIPNSDLQNQPLPCCFEKQQKQAKTQQANAWLILASSLWPYESTVVYKSKLGQNRSCPVRVSSSAAQQMPSPHLPTLCSLLVAAVHKGSIRKGTSSDTVDRDQSCLANTNSSLLQISKLHCSYLSVFGVEMLQVFFLVKIA